ncbi:MAG: hypothetical protein PHF86_01230 [Candidatus Nanoarchaeia archaeon]|nr:hypothetical protein [Candidatus Nanoarchaeia archaeon]
MTINFKHKKSGRIYEVISDKVINATNEQDGQQMILYIGEKKDGSGKGTFVREAKEFYSKFEECDKI